MKTIDDYKPHRIKRYGYRPDLPDHRDYYYTVSQPVATPPIVDLRPICPTIIYDQGKLGSCTANALAALYQCHEIAQKKITQFMPSRLFIYYNERVLENTVGSDSGASLRDGIRALSNWGVPDENLWPYHIENFLNTPPDPIFASAKKNVVSQYNRVNQRLTDMRTLLASGNPFVIGFMVYEGFESKAVAETGTLNMPSYNEQALGGHAVLVVGYNDKTSRFLIRNSWGPKWGAGGYFTMPYEYALNSDLVGDMWSIQMVP